MPHTSRYTSDSTISDLKEWLEAKTRVPYPRQKLIGWSSAHRRRAESDNSLLCDILLCFKSMHRDDTLLYFGWRAPTLGSSWASPAPSLTPSPDPSPGVSLSSERERADCF